MIVTCSIWKTNSCICGLSASKDRFPSYSSWNRSLHIIAEIYGERYSWCLLEGYIQSVRLCVDIFKILFLNCITSRFTLVTHLLDLQQAAIQFFSAIFTVREGQTDCLVAPLIPVVTESYAIYLLTVHLLKQLVKRMFGQLREHHS